jgi:hypothetical protein
MSTLTTKLIIGFLLLVAAWNALKMPFLMAFGNDDNDTYNDRGIELSINLGHWVKGYRSKKMRTPPCNFLLVHMSLGITIVVMMCLSLTNKRWRKKYCVPFFIFSILEGIHAIPASLINEASIGPLPLVYLFIFACSMLIGMGVWGLHTKFFHPEQAERNFAIQYTWITIINASAAFLETPEIVAALKSKDPDTGLFKNYGDAPHEKFGNTFYDKFPEKIGRNIFLAFCGLVWVVWPIYLLNIKKTKVE